MMRQNIEQRLVCIAARMQTAPFQHAVKWAILPLLIVVWALTVGHSNPAALQGTSNPWLLAPCISDAIKSIDAEDNIESAATICS